VQSVRAEADARGIALVAEVDPRLRGARVHDDATRIAEILRHLIDNTVQWSGGRHVRVAVAACPGPDGAGEELCWSVDDDGQGLAAATVARVFQGSDAAAESSENTGSAGLGVPLCRRLCAALGGRIEVRTSPGAGTRVLVHLPRLPLPEGGAALAADGHGTAIPRAEVGRERIRGRVLLVEDSPDNQRLLAQLLRGAGAEVEVAADGLAAIERAQAAERAEESYAIVLMDMQMPVMDGASATRELRAAGFSRPILALTAQTVAEAREECLSAGCDDVASKPIDRRTLIAAVARLIDAHAAKMQ
jgi:Amt family ammonium transporter